MNYIAQQLSNYQLIGPRENQLMFVDFMGHEFTTQELVTWTNI